MLLNRKFLQMLIEHDNTFSQLPHARLRIVGKLTYPNLVRVVDFVGTVFTIKQRHNLTRFGSKTRLQPMPRTTADGSCFAIKTSSGIDCVRVTILLKIKNKRKARDLCPYYEHKCRFNQPK